MIKGVNASELLVAVRVEAGDGQVALGDVAAEVRAGAVDVAVFRGRPHFDGDWARVVTTSVEGEGLQVAGTDVPAGAGTHQVEVWVRPPAAPEAVTFVLLG